MKYALALLLLLLAPVWADPVSDELAWRQQREAALRQPSGWLTLAGLFWLDPGVNTFGSDKANVCQFPASAPARLGTFTLQPDGTVSVAVESPVEVRVDDQSIRQYAWGPQDDEAAHVMTCGTLSWYVIRRDGRVAIRLKDSASPVLAGFKGIEYYPIDPAWRVDAHFEPYTPPRAVSAPSALGTETTVELLGTATFTVHGQTCRLQAVDSGDGQLEFIFADQTSGHGTYPAGRYLDAPMPDAQGHTVLDFNQAYNPPCAFTHFATCVYPRTENRLAVPIEAGEKYTPH